jgi:hypothetical protein
VDYLHARLSCPCQVNFQIIDEDRTIWMDARFFYSDLENSAIRFSHADSVRKNTDRKMSQIIKSSFDMGNMKRRCI